VSCWRWGGRAAGVATVSGVVTLAIAGAGAVAVAAAILWVETRTDTPATQVPIKTAAPATNVQIERGRYLARAGNCQACHTAPGGAAYGGGVAINTPFGATYSSNLTPHSAYGIGRWSASDFWRALHEGRSRGGRLLYPTFPYTSYTHVAREDADAIFAYLRSLPPAATPNRPHTLRFPYSTQTALLAWRTLYFTPGQVSNGAINGATPSADWNRGAYLVRGLGHCVACHAPRNALGATSETQGLSGGMVATLGWYAPALNAAEEAGVAGWETADIVQLLRTGSAKGSTVSGPMAAVVYDSTQHLTPQDLGAMAVYLKALPQAPPKLPPNFQVRPTAIDLGTAQRGAKVYEQHCAQCHGDQGEGAAGAYPPLAGNRAVTLASTANLVQTIRLGGFAPATAGNPRPYSMPPLGDSLTDTDIAAVLTYIRTQWGNAAAPVTALDVLQR
jgi:mono/diheme cytochrome c family protein